GHGDHEAVNLLVHRRVDELGLLLRVAVALVGHVVTEVGAGLLHAGLDDAPKRVAAGAVRHHRDLVAVFARTAGIVVVVGLRLVDRVSAAAGGGGEQQAQRRQDQRASHLEHRVSSGGGGFDASVGGREVVGGGYRVGHVRPPRGDHLCAGVEPDALGAVDV